MNTRRFAALALVTCAASLSVTACTAGITTTAAVGTASPARASTAATGRTASAAAATGSPSPASSGSTVAMGGSIGSFPVPPGAKIGETGGGAGEIVLIFGSVTPSKVSSFYATALPRAGYTISMNSMLSQNGSTAAIVEFTGHGYKGNIDALSTYPSTGVTISGLGHKNVTTISFLPK